MEKEIIPKKVVAYSVLECAIWEKKERYDNG